MAPEAAGNCAQLGGLGFDDVEILLFRERQVAPVGDLRHFALADDIRRPADHAAGGGVAETAGQVKGVREEIIAQEDAGLVRPS